MQNKFFSALDLGSNSFHIIIVEADNTGSFKVIDRERETIRLGSGSVNDLRLISPEEIEKAIAILKRFKKLAELYGAKLKAVATSAVREASNNQDLIKRVYNETGIEVEVIDGKKEALLIYLGVQHALSLKNKKASTPDVTNHFVTKLSESSPVRKWFLTTKEKVLCVDIGGGSSEFISGNDGKIIFAESLEIGAVRLSRKFFPDYLLSEQSIKLCEEYIEQQILTNNNIKLNCSFEIAVGASGTILSIAALIHYSKSKSPLKSLNGFSFSSEELKEITSLVLEKKTVEERKLLNGIELNRADIIPAGLLILNKTFELFKLKEMTISEYGLREGIIVEMLEK